jgi:predicted ATPase
LERLTEADILFVEGHGPQATYRFKHALIQDAAYDSLLKSRRQALHAQAAEILRDSPERAAVEPEAVAHHFTQAGLDDLAIEWWGKAGDQALRRSAFQEAIAHLGKAIAMADKVAASPSAGGNAATSGRRLKLQTDFAHAVLWSKGYGADETKAAFERTADLASRLGLSAERFPAYYGQWAWSMLRGDARAARGIAEGFLRAAEADRGVAEIGVGHRMLGLTYAYLGDLVGAQGQLELALNSHDRGRSSEVREKFGFDSEVATRANLAYACCLSGDLDRARQLIEEAMRLARELTHLPSTMNALVYKGLVEIERNDLQNLAADAETLLRLSQQHGMEMFVAWSRIYLSWAHARLGDARRGAAELRDSLAAFTSQGNQLGVPGYLVLLAELEVDAGNAEVALTLIDNGLAMAQEGGQHYADSFLHRLRGDIILRRDPANLAPAEEAYRTAIVIAKQQAARGYELRAALALAKLYQLTARPVEAHAVLAPALGGFATAPGMPEIAEAQALVAALAETDEVKADARQRRRLTQLQTAYGNALLQARGIGAPETTEAFARARDGALGDKDTPERLAVHYGLWAGSSVRGDLSEMRAHAEAFLNDVEGRPDSPEAGVAHRAAGLTFWFAGDYREARDQLQKALILFEPGRDDDLAFRFGLDPGVAAMGWLAIASWPLGEVDRAISLIDRMQTRMANLTHIGTLANGRMYAALFELLRGDRARGAPNTLELVRLAQVYDLNLWRAFGVFLEGWSSAASGSGLEGMRHGVELLRNQNVLWFDGLLKMALAEAEAQGGDPGGAVAILNEALATCDRTGYRAFEAELRRARGEMLLKRDPTNPAPPEEDFLAAIAVAKQQGTRSFELRATLALAKLHQSTGHPAAAHAVLAPALNDFALTSQMPEIAEAQALLGTVT